MHSFGIGFGVRAIPLILKATQRARAQRLASLGAGRVALCVITGNSTAGSYGSVPKSQCHYSVISLYSAYNVSQLQCNYSVITGNSTAGSYGSVPKSHCNYSVI